MYCAGRPVAIPPFRQWQTLYVIINQISEIVKLTIFGLYISPEIGKLNNKKAIIGDIWIL